MAELIIAEDATLIALLERFDLSTQED